MLKITQNVCYPYWVIKINKIVYTFSVHLFIDTLCPSTVAPGQAMTTDFSSSRINVGDQFTATCNTGYAFFRSSGSGGFIESTTKIATCTYTFGSSGGLSGSSSWTFTDNTNSLGNCIGNTF